VEEEIESTTDEGNEEEEEGGEVAGVVTAIATGVCLFMLCDCCMVLCVAFEFPIF